jgi:hypothetical protein
MVYQVQRGQLVGAYQVQRAAAGSLFRIQRPVSRIQRGQTAGRFKFSEDKPPSSGTAGSPPLLANAWPKQQVEIGIELAFKARGTAASPPAVAESETPGTGAARACHDSKTMPGCHVGGKSTINHQR